MKKNILQYMDMYIYVLIVTLYKLFTGKKLPLRINSKQRVASKYKACFKTP